MVRLIHTGASEAVAVLHLSWAHAQSGPTRAKQSVLFLIKSLQHNEAEENPMPPQDLSVYLPFPFLSCVMRTALWKVGALLQLEHSEGKESKHTAVVA